MTRDHVAERIRRLMALAAPGSGASEEERRTAAAQVVRLMIEHGLVPGPPTAIDRDEVTRLALRVIELEHLLAEERTALASELRALNEQWRRDVDAVKREERAAARKSARVATRRGAVQERTAQARAGARARDEKLDDERKKEIARTAAGARWARWRERHGEPR